MTVHLTLMGKGGVGKTLVSVFLAQYLQNKGENLLCIDADPVNHSFSQFKSLPIEALDLIKDNTIDPRAFDTLINKIIISQDTCIVDNGASTFTPLTAYMIENQIVEFLDQQNIEVYIHIILAGGPQLMETLKGFDYLAEQFGSKAKLIIWLNPYFGSFEAPSSPGKAFQDMKVFQKHKNTVYGVISIPNLNPVTFGADINQMLVQNDLFKDFLGAEKNPIMVRQRVKIFQEKLNEQLATVL